jgi:hypothetical protein
MAVSDSLSSGRADLLKALLKDIARRYDENENPNYAKQLAVEIREIAAELDELEPQVVEKPKTPLDELRAKREARKTG